MSVAAEVRVIGWLNGTGSIGAPTSGDVPADRPDEFLTVERVGGARGDVVETPIIAVQAWSTSRVNAEALAGQAADSLEAMVALSDVADVEVQSIINDPDPDSQQARFQVTAQLTVTTR